MDWVGPGFRFHGRSNFTLNPYQKYIFVILNTLPGFRNVNPLAAKRQTTTIGRMFNCASLTSDNAAFATLDGVGKSVQKEIEVIQECINKNLTEHPGVILGDPGGLPQA